MGGVFTVSLKKKIKQNTNASFGGVHPQWDEEWSGKGSDLKPGRAVTHGITLLRQIMLSCSTQSPHWVCCGKRARELRWWGREVDGEEEHKRSDVHWAAAGERAQLYEARPRKKPPTKPLDRTMFLLRKSVACAKSEKDEHSWWKLRKQRRERPLIIHPVKLSPVRSPLLCLWVLIKF